MISSGPYNISEMRKGLHASKLLDFLQKYQTVELLPAILTTLHIWNGTQSKVNKQELSTPEIKEAVSLNTGNFSPHLLFHVNLNILLLPCPTFTS